MKYINKIVENIKSKFSDNSLKSRIDELEKQLAERPDFDMIRVETGIRLPNLVNDVTLLDIRDIARLSIIIRTCILHLRNEIFRRGYEFQEKFKTKCATCGIEYDIDIDTCEECGGNTLKPDKKQKQAAETFFKKVNENCQSFLDVCKQVEEDLDIFDDGYIILLKSYLQDNEGNIIKSDVKEILRGDPVSMRIVADNKGKLGGKYFICLQHRDKHELRQGRCRICNKKLYDVFFVATGGGETAQTYYVENEVIHTSKYEPSLLYGFSPIFTFWKTAITLLSMEAYICDYYRKQRNPRGIVAVTTQNQDSLEKQVKTFGDRLRVDPHYVPFIAIESDSGRGKMEFIRFMDSLNEMQYIPAKDDMRQRISGFYGVSNIFMADVSTSGGLNNEGLQITVTNRAVEFGQKVYHDRIFPQVLSALGTTDYELCLLPSEEEDEMAALQRHQQKVAIAEGYLRMGFDVKLNDVGEFEYSGEAKKPFAAVPMTEQLPEITFDKGEITKSIWDDAILAIQQRAMFQVYENVTDVDVIKIHEAFKEEFLQDQFSIKRLTDKIIEIAGISKEAAERIARTESTAIINKAREISYERRDPKGEFKYKWSGPNDHRTCEICSEIKKIVTDEGKGNGVSLMRLRQIVNEVVQKHTGTSPARDWMPHPNTRHSIVRVV